MDKNVSKRLKRILGIAVPALVMLIAIIMVSVSFAWFSSDVKPAVQSFNLTTAKMFTLNFQSDGTSSARNINYKGQTAIDKNGRLVTDYNGREYARPDKVEINQYLLDMPYYFITTIELDTEDLPVEMSMALDVAKISKNDKVINSYDVGEGGSSPDDLPYVFTWYFKEHVENSQNYVGNVEGEEDNRRMDNSLPKADEIWYTPYGKLKFGDNGLISQVNDTPVAGAAEEGGYSLLTNGVQNIGIKAKETKYDFHIVFAPEKLYWSQFCASDRKKKVDEIYSAAELEKIFGTSSTNRMYYSNTAYYGAKFEFGATIRIAEINGEPV